MATSGLHTGPRVVHVNDEQRPPTRESGMAGKKICWVCADEIGLKAGEEVFVACSHCGFPVCKPCYEYERSGGNYCCPQCHTRYKRHKGCPRVAGDDDDDFEMTWRTSFRSKLI